MGYIGDIYICTSVQYRVACGACGVFGDIPAFVGSHMEKKMGKSCVSVISRTTRNPEP